MYDQSLDCDRKHLTVKSGARDQIPTAAAPSFHLTVSHIHKEHQLSLCGLRTPQTAKPPSCCHLAPLKLVKSVPWILCFTTSLL